MQVTTKTFAQRNFNELWKRTVSYVDM